MIVQNKSIFWKKRIRGKRIFAFSLLFICNSILTGQKGADMIIELNEINCEDQSGIIGSEKTIIYGSCKLSELLTFLTDGKVGSVEIKENPCLEIRAISSEPLDKKVLFRNALDYTLKKYKIKNSVKYSFEEGVLINSPRTIFFEEPPQTRGSQIIEENGILEIKNAGTDRLIQFFSKGLNINLTFKPDYLEEKKRLTASIPMENLKSLESLQNYLISKGSGFNTVTLELRTVSYYN